MRQHTHADERGRDKPRRARPVFCRLLTLLPFGALILVAGCYQQEEIRSYAVPKEAAPPVLAADANPTPVPLASEPSEPTDRMLAAVLPAGDRAWFLKVTGPIADMEKQEKSIEEFFSSVKAAPGNEKPSWKLPEDWTEKPGAGMRAATVMIPADGAPLELSVIGLPWSGAEGELLTNINRWRGQMKLPEVGKDGLADFTREQKVGNATMTIVDLRGNFSAGSMTAPFARGGLSGGARPPAVPLSEGGNEGTSDPGLPAGHPPIDPSQPIAAAVPLTFTASEGWQTLPVGGMRKAAFGIIDGDQKALVTVIDFPVSAGPMMADPLENINRWRREVGLAEIDKGALDENVESTEVGGHKATYVEMLPDDATPAESQAPLATAAAMVTAGDQIWFFKLTGDRDLVSRERDNFKSFLQSVKFTEQ